MWKNESQFIYEAFFMARITWLMGWANYKQLKLNKFFWDI